MNSSRRWRRCSPRRAGIGPLLGLLLALSFLNPASIAAQTACGTYAVATAPQPVGNALTENVVTLTSGQGQTSMGIFEQPHTAEPTPKPGVALLRSYGGVLGLMDVATGKVTPLNIPEAEQTQLTSTFPTIRNAAESDFMLLSSGPGANWLVDLTNGDAVNLSDLDGENSFVETAQISADGKWALYSTGDTGYLISLETARAPQPIDSDPLISYPSFDSDGNVVYGVEGKASKTIRSLDPRTGKRTDIVTAPGVRFIPLQSGDPLLMLDQETVLAYEDGDSAPRAVYDWSEGPSGIFLDVAGEHLLIGETFDDVTNWTWVDLSGGTSVAVGELDGMSPVTRSARQDAVFFQPTARVEPGVPGAAYRVIDLMTGDVTTVLEQDSTEICQSKVAGDAEGRFTLVNAVSPGSGRVWLIDGQMGTATLVATSSGNADARVSPDGCQLAIGIYDSVGQGRTSSVSVESMTDGAPVLSVSDALLLGWVDVSRTE